ncbi:MAG: hypothetical protein RL120_14185 [Gammaproteobacteria bacterium]
MRKIFLFCLLLAMIPASAQDPMPPADYWNASDLAKALEQAATERPAMAVSRLTNADDIRINLIRRTEAAGAIVHRVGTELHYITGGAGTLVTGGVVIRADSGGPGRIEGGMARRVSTGDAILIPEGTPHQYTEVEGFVSYLEVRYLSNRAL